MNVNRHVAIGLCAAALVATPLYAHHSWSIDYDLSQSKRIYGTVHRVIFQSPHSAILIDVETADGQSERWRVEWGSPTRLRDRGVDGNTLRAGDEVASVAIRIAIRRRSRCTSSRSCARATVCSSA